MNQGTLTRRRLATAILAGAAISPLMRSHRAYALPMPAGKPILTVSGTITVSNQRGEAIFDRAMLEELGLDQITTTTPWNSGLVRFDGVPLESLMQALGATGSFVTAYALNDFTTKIPISDFKRFHPILALTRNGEYMPVRDKGPLFIVYPFDSNPELKQQIYYNRSAWQVARLLVQ
jgi:hypothetical protein